MKLAPTQQNTREQGARGEQDGGQTVQATATPGVANSPVRDSLRTLNYDDGAAAVSPFQAKSASGAPVQFKLTVGAQIETVDAKTVDDMLAAVQQTAAWQAIVQLHKDATVGGTRPLDPSSRDDIVLELLIMLESAFRFGGEANIDALWDNEVLITRMVKTVEKAATPEPATEPDKPAEPEQPAAEPVKLPDPGTFGMLTEATILLSEDGTEIPLSAGETIEAMRAADGRLVVEVHSGAAGKVGSIDPTHFKAQPRISTNDDTHKTENYTYEEYVGELFLARNGVTAPSVADVDQGSLGDCYLIAAMGAVAASNPDVIRDMISYDAGAGLFTVTFQEMQRNGTFKPHTETVDSFLPTRRGTKRTAYAQSDQAFDPKNQALWPAIIEKAYAQWQGGYHVLDEGGNSAKTMQLFTGVRSVRESMPSVDDVVGHFEGWQAENKAVVCGSRDWIDQRSQTGLIEGSGDGPYTGKLTDKDGAGAEIVKSTVRIRDTEGESGSVTDDGKGALTGSNVDTGGVEYENGALHLGYKEGKGPGSGAALEATYRYEGTLSSALNVHGNHAYIFREVKDGLLYFHNPWGPAAHKHPKGVTASQFRDLFETIGVNSTIPQQER